MVKVFSFIKSNKIKCSILAALIAFSCTHKSNTYIENRVVKLFSAAGSCTGEQVRAPSGVDYILTAAHCLVLQDDKGYIAVKTEDGKILKRRVIAEDAFSDLLLLEGLPGLRGLDIAFKSSFKQSVRSFTHGRGYDTYETEGVLIQSFHINIQMDPDKCLTGMPKYKTIEASNPWTGEKDNLCSMYVLETATTALIVPGSSGGPIVNSLGDLVGVVSAGDSTFGYLVTLDDIHSFINNY